MKLPVPIQLFVAGCAVLAQGNIVPPTDTLLTGNGTPGPYRLGTQYVDSASLKASWVDTANGGIGPFIYVGTLNGILFSQPIDSGRAFKVSYAVSYRSLPKVVQAFEPRMYDSTTNVSDSLSVARTQTAGSYRRENVTVSGYKSIGVSFGNLGQLAVDQALDVTVAGEINPRTELSAHISDQGTSLDGATREISELDLVYVTLTHPAFGVTVGDQYVQWPLDGPFAGSRKIKGIEAHFAPTRFSAGAYGALSGGQTAQQTIAGRDGQQGPYFLSGNGESELISPVSGTVQVSVDGKTLKEGDNADFTVDYETGALTFTPRFLVTRDKIIRVVYEYKTYDYLRTTVGTNLGFAVPDSTLVAQGAFQFEGDSRTQPIDFALSAADKDALRRAGDNESRALFVRELDPNTVADESALAPLYREIDTTINGQTTTVFVYSPFDPLAPVRATGYYRVSFVNVDSGSGDYVLDRFERNTAGIAVPVHRWAGPGMGTYTVPDSKPAPQSMMLGQFRFGLKPRKWFSLISDIAATDRDRNLFSTADDSDNRGALIQTRLSLGTRIQRGRSLWATINHRLSTAYFGREFLDTWELRNRWHEEQPDTGSIPRQVVEAEGGFAPGDLFGITLRGGQLRRGSLASTSRGGMDLALHPGDHFQFTLSSDMYAHERNPMLRTSRTDNILFGATYDRYSLSVNLFDETRSGASGPKRGHVGSRGRLQIEPLGLEEQLVYTQQQTGQSRAFFFRAHPDSGSTVEWQQKLDISPLRTWNLGGSSVLYQRTGPQGERARTLLATLTNTVNVPRSGLSLSQRYELSIEQASAVVQVPTYAGKNLGTHKYDSLTGEYVIPRSGPGDYLMVQREMFDTLGGVQVRTGRLDVSWSYTPRGGAAMPLLDALTWRGGLHLEEHIAEDSISDRFRGRSWVPGALTLSKVGDYSNRLTYSDCSYRQELRWRPESTSDLLGELELRPYVRQSLIRREAGVNGLVGMEGMRKQVFLRCQIDENFFRSARQVAGDWYRAYDLSTTLTQRYHLPADIRISLAERAGRAQIGQRRFGQPDSSWYFSLKPALSWNPQSGGFAELSYTAARVLVPGTLDYRLADGLSAGVSHIVELFADIELGEHFVLNTTGRALWQRPWESDIYTPEFVLSMQVKAFL